MIIWKTCFTSGSLNLEGISDFYKVEGELSKTSQLLKVLHLWHRGAILELAGALPTSDSPARAKEVHIFNLPQIESPLHARPMGKQLIT